MNKELILQAVNAVIEFNSSADWSVQSTIKSASISVNKGDCHCCVYGDWDGEKYNQVYAEWVKTDVELQEFINKLNKLGGK